MYIISQNKQHIYNIDNVLSVDLFGGEIRVAVTHCNSFVMGEYPEDRARDIFLMLLAVIAPIGETQESEPGVWVQTSQPQAIYLPEE